MNFGNFPGHNIQTNCVRVSTYHMMAIIFTMKFEVEKFVTTFTWPMADYRGF